jgi:predicted nuclease of predicted toxin-antitoxin system
VRLLSNENFPLASSLFLKAQGHDVLCIGLEFMGITDRQVIDLANKESRTILTFDADYGELIFKYDLKPEEGVIFLRLRYFQPEDPGRIVNQLVLSAMFSAKRALTVIDGDVIRQRRY